MISSDNCFSNDKVDIFKQKLYRRRLFVYKMIRDSLERKMASITASISKLEEQINRASDLDVVN